MLVDLPAADLRELVETSPLAVAAVAELNLFLDT
jgi:hypothetical protein